MTKSILEGADAHLKLSAGIGPKKLDYEVTLKHIHTKGFYSRFSLRMESHSAWFQNPESLFLVIFTMWQNALETSCCNSYSQYAQNMGSSISKVTKWALKGSEGDFTQPDVEGNCPAEYWKCKDGLQCLRRDRVCDGTAWCYDNSDEYLVTRAQWNCLAGSWECKDGLRCLRGENVCDGRTHCIDESDENHAMCAQWTCPPGHWKCKDGRQCLRNERVCDGGMIPDCKDKSDEDPVICAQWKCAAGFWKCHDGLKCIEEGSVCDGNPSCNDISDEDPALCAQWNCTAGYWKCKDGLQCILERDVCYAQYDCNDKSDEDQTMCDQFICKENKIGLVHVTINNTRLKTGTFTLFTLVSLTFDLDLQICPRHVGP